jgi:phospholipid/cholesterol/gamma-HCH transport system permease protein
MITAPLRYIGRQTLGFLGDTGATWRLAVSATDRAMLAPFRGERVRVPAIVEQALRAGYSSLPLVALISFLMGMIMALQSAHQLRELGAIELVADLVALVVIRELAPLLTAIIVAGRFGSAIAAELGTMKVSQEIDALTVMGIDPVSFLVAPRLIALAVSLPCLVIFADVVGILGGLMVSVGALGIGLGAYVSNTADALVLEDVFMGLVKSLAFAAIIGLVGCQRGLQTEGGADEVGRSTTSAVVRSIVLVIAADLFVTAFEYLRR